MNAQPDSTEKGRLPARGYSDAARAFLTWLEQRADAHPAGSDARAFWLSRWFAAACNLRAREVHHGGL